MNVAYLTEDDVRALVTLPEVIDSLDATIQRQGEGTAVDIGKSMAEWDSNSSAHTLGGVDVARGLCVFKNWVNTPRGAAALLTLFDAQSGSPIAVMEAAYLGSLRTAAIAGLATRAFAAPEANRLLVCGSGRQALRQVEAIHAVRPLAAVTVWSPTQTSRERFAEEVAETLSVPTSASETLADAMSDEIGIVTLMTRAREPFFGTSLLGRGPVHINAMGAVLPLFAELEREILVSADIVAVDSPDNARAASRELIGAFGTSLTGVVRLGDVIALGRDSAADQPRLTIFKAMGMGLSDLAAAIIVAQNADLIQGVS